MFFLLSFVAAAHASFSIVNAFSAGSPISASQMNANFSGIATAINGVESLSSSFLSGVLSVGNGGTGLSTMSSGAVLLGNGTSAVSSVAAGTAGNVLVDNGTSWASQTLASTTSQRSCSTGNSNDVMVAVGSWCVDAYQASVWSGAGGTGSQQFSAGTNGNYNLPTDAPSNCALDGSGSGCTGYAVSKPNVMPARGITWFQAVVACANSGKQLIPDAVWQMAAVGTQKPTGTNTGTGGTSGGSATDNASTAVCNINTSCTGSSWACTNGGARYTAMAGSTPGGAASCISRFGVQDMVGNLWEWTDMTMQAGGITGFSVNTGNAYALPQVGVANGSTWNLNGSAAGPTGWVSGAPAAARRGGGWTDSTDAGVFALYLNNAPSCSYWNIGFRCARPR